MTIYKMNRTTARGTFIMSVFAILAGFFMVAMFGPLGANIIGLGFMFSIIAVSQYNLETLRAGDEHFELKMAPLLPRKFIKHSDVISVEHGDKKLLLKVVDGGKEKLIKMPAHLFSKEDRKEIGDYFDNLNSAVS